MSNTKRKLASSNSAAPPILNSGIGVNSQQNTTFLPIDSILYPKETNKKAQLKQLKARQQGVLKQAELAGLKGFGKSAQRVSMLMNEKMIEEMEKQIKNQQAEVNEVPED